MGDADGACRAQFSVAVRDLRISRERRQYLEGRLRWNKARCEPPCADMSIQSPGELIWLARRFGWRVLPTLTGETWRARLRNKVLARVFRLPQQGSPPDMRRAILEDVDLSGMNLAEAKLEGATFNDRCVVTKTCLIGADLRGAEFNGMEIQRAILLDQNAVRALPQDGSTASLPSRIEVQTRNELLWLLAHGYTTYQLGLRSTRVYEKDLKNDFKGIQVDPDSVKSETAEKLLEGILANRANGNLPFFGLSVGDWKDLYWLKLVSRYRPQGSPELLKLPLDLRRADLSGGMFVGADLHRVNLRRANLAKARLAAANLSFAWLDRADLTDAQAPGVDLYEANLVRARLFSAHLEGASLVHAKLHEARLDGAHLRGARLAVSDLRGAGLRAADLECADLRGAQVDAATNLIDAKASEGTQWGDIVWHSTPLLDINWHGIGILGDESTLEINVHFGRDYQSGVPEQALGPGQKLQEDGRDRAYRDVMRAYRQLHLRLYEQGFYGVARRLRLREKAILRKQLWEHRMILQLGYSWTSNLLVGYGERPGRLLLPYTLVIGVWSTLYYALAHRLVPFIPAYKADNSVTVIQALALSVSTFRGQPNFPGPLLSQHFVGFALQSLGAIETAIGTIILLAITLLWSRRLFGEEIPVVRSTFRAGPLAIRSPRGSRPLQDQGGETAG